MRWIRPIVATLVLAAALCWPSAASAASISLLPSSRTAFKTILISSVRPGEWIARADLTVVNMDRLDLIWCAMWANPRESGGGSGWQRVDVDSVVIGKGSHLLDDTIHLEAVFDSTRRFQVKVQCGHNISGFRPYVEPGARMRLVENRNA